MPDMNPAPRDLPEPPPPPPPPPPQTPQGTTTPTGSVWMRALFMVIVAMLIGLAVTVLHFLTLVQFVLMLFDKGKPNPQIADFGNRLGPWLAKAAAFQTAQTESKPWPFDQT